MKQMDSANLIGLILVIVSFFLGVLASIAAGVRLSFLQFQSSTAGYRVKMVTTATQEMVEAAKRNAYVGTLQDKYRYSLGVILNELTQKFGHNGFNSDGGWPLLIDYDNERPKDRWGRFNKYIRPVIDDINVYAFVAEFPRHRRLDFFFGRLYDRPFLQKLGKLTELCQQLETVVGELDAAFEVNQNVAYVKDGAIFPVSDGEQTAVSRLTQEFRSLHSIWRQWLDLAIGKD